MPAVDAPNLRCHGPRPWHHGARPGSVHGSRLIRRLAAAIVAAGLSFGAIGVRPALAAATAGDDTYGAAAPLVLEDVALAVPAPGILANDAAGAGESLCVVSPPTTSDQGGTVSIAADGSFTYPPPVSYAGPDSFTYGVAGVSGGGPCPGTADDTAVVSLTVTQVNDAPALSFVGDCSGGITVDEDAGTFDDECVDVNLGPANESGQVLAELQVETNGDVAFAFGPTITFDGDLQFQPVPNDFGTATVSIRGRDDGGTANGGQNLSAAVVLTITVDPVADAPVASPDAFAALKDRTLNIAAPGVLGNDSDADGDALSAELASSPIHGDLTLAANGSFSYTPDAGYVGSDAFSYRASDGALTSAIRIVTLTVSAVPAPTPTSVVTAPPTPVPTVEPTAEVTAEPTIEPFPSPEPGLSAAPTAVAPTASGGPAATPEPDSTSEPDGLSLPVLLVAVLFGVLLVFAGAYAIPRWIRNQRGELLDPE